MDLEKRAKLFKLLWSSFISNGYRGLFLWGQSGRGVKLTTHLHLVQSSTMRGAIPPLPNMPSWRDAHLKWQGF